MSDDAQKTDKPAHSAADRIAAANLAPVLKKLGTKRGKQATWLVALVFFALFARLTPSTAPTTTSRHAPGTRQAAARTAGSPFADSTQLELYQLNNVLAERDAEIRAIEIEQYSIRKQLGIRPALPNAADLRTRYGLLDQKLTLARQMRAADLKLQTTTLSPPAVTTAAPAPDSLQ